MFKKVVLSLIFVFFMFSAGLVLADDNFVNYGLGNSNLGAGSIFGNADIPSVIARVIQVIMGLSATFMLAIIIYSGFLYLTSRGESAKTKKALDLIKSSSIGIIIIVTAYSISQFIISNIKFIAS